MVFLEWSIEPIRLTVANKIAIGAADFIYCTRFWAIDIILDLWVRKHIFDSS